MFVSELGPWGFAGQQYTCTLWAHLCCAEITACLQARFPLIQRVSPAADDASQGNATQAGGPFRYLLQANSTGATLSATLFAYVYFEV